MNDLEKILLSYNESKASKVELTEDELYSEKFAQYVIDNSNECQLSSILSDFRAITVSNPETSEYKAKTDELPLHKDIVKSSPSYLMNAFSELFAATAQKIRNVTSSKYALNNQVLSKTLNSKNHCSINNFTTNTQLESCSVHFSGSRKNYEMHRVIRRVREYEKILDTQLEETSNLALSNTEHAHLKLELEKFIHWRINQKEQKLRYDIVENSMRRFIDGRAVKLKETAKISAVKY
jgi:hypothetical protein